MIKLSEIFLSISGEGLQQGNPTVFVRTYGCNNNCAYCDSEFATKGDDYQEMSIDDIIKKVKEIGKPYYYICITGGEPLLQKDMEWLVDRLSVRGYKIWLETNGTQDIKPYMQMQNVSIVMDIKCPSSKMENNTLWKNLRYLRKDDEIKFVIATEQDYQYAKTIVQTLSYLTKAQMIFSPAFETDKFKPKDLLTPAKIVEKMLADKLFIRLSLQSHKMIWSPDKRGV